MLRRRTLLLLALAFGCLASLHVGGVEATRLEMRDGTGLATDIHLPEGSAAALPVLLVRTPYGRALHLAESKTVSERGYALVVQDVRGLGGSEGRFNAFADDGWNVRQDGVDTVRWILEQPWCNGRIGTYGASALAVTQELLGPASGDLACQTMVVGASRFYAQVAYQGGVLRKSLCEGWLAMFGEEGQETLRLWKSHPRDGEFWSFYDAEAAASRATAPGLHVGGWYDIFALGTIHGFLARQHEGGPGARGNQKMIMRPTGHGDFPPGCAFTLPENFDDVRVSHVARRFQDHWLKGEDNGIMDEPAIWYYTIGDDKDPEAPGMEWRRADDWPPFPIRASSYYLNADGTLGTIQPTRAGGRLSFTYDPDDPCPTVGGQNLLLPLGPFDQRPVSGRSDVLTFTSVPLPQPVEATGPVRVVLYVSSDAPDTDFTAKLVDVYPEGDDREILVLDSIHRVKFRDGFDKAAAPLEPDEVVRVEIDLWHTSWVFNKGHRIGLQVSSSNYPRFEKNPNNGLDFPDEETDSRVARNTVHASREHPSALILPIPARDDDGEGP